MARRMLIDASHPEETRVVVVDGTKLTEFDFETASRRPLKGNIYLARVTRVEPSLQAAFVEYGGNRHGFLAFSEIHPDYWQIPVADRQALLEMEAAEEAAAAGEEEAEAGAEAAEAAEAEAAAASNAIERAGEPADLFPVESAPEPGAETPADMASPTLDATQSAEMAETPAAQPLTQTTARLTERDGAEPAAGAEAGEV